MNQNAHNLAIQSQVFLQQIIRNKNLPSISINDLKKQLKAINKNKNKIQYQINSKTFHENQNELNVSSPFYQRMKMYKQSCQCSYHKKMKIAPPIIQRKPKQNLEIDEIKKYKKPRVRQTLQRFSLKQPSQFNYLKKSSKFNCRLTKLTSNDSFKLIQKQIKPLVDTKNQSYKIFLKQFQRFSLHQRSQPVQYCRPSHLIKTGVKQIFQYLKSHLDYNVDQIKEYINSIEKDKQYTDFYIDRFKQMKRNYQRKVQIYRNSKRSNSSNQFYRASSSFLIKNQKRNSKKKNTKQINDLQSSSQLKQSQFPKSFIRQNIHNNFNKSNDNFTVILDKIKRSIILQNSQIQQLMNSQLSNFKKRFNKINQNIINSQYDRQTLENIKNQLLKDLQKRLQQNITPNDQSDEKIKIIKETLDLINISKQTISAKRRQSKLYGRKSIRNSISIEQGLLGILGSKKNANSKDREQYYGKSHHANNANRLNKKRFTGQFDQQTSPQIYTKNQKNILKQPRKGFIKQSENNQNKLLVLSRKIIEQSSLTQSSDESESNSRKQLLKKFQKKFGDFSDYNSKSSNNENLSNKYGDDKVRRGLLKKVQNYLQDTNLNDLIVKADDRVFTVKRKLRILKNIAQFHQESNNQNVSTSNKQQTSQLQYVKCYIDTIEDRCKKLIKTTRKNKAITQDYYQKDNKIIKEFIDESIQITGQNLIFYKLQTQMKFHQNDEDLCLMLHEIKMRKKLNYRSNMSQKSILMAKSIVSVKQEKQKLNRLSLLAQKDMNSYEQHENQCYYDIDSKQIQSQNHQNKKSQVKLVKNSQNKGKKEKIKKILNYTKQNLPNTFNKYLKNTSIYQQSIDQ